MADLHSSSQSPLTSKSSGTPLALRWLWMFLGNVVLGICALSIVTERDHLVSLADVVYGVTVVVVIAARYLDIARYHGETAYGEPATMAHWRRYALALVLGSAAAWLALHGIAYALMN